MRLTINALVCAPGFRGSIRSERRGSITDTITDPAGAVFQAATSSTDNYMLAQLPVAQYQLTAKIADFKQFLQTGITVLVAQTLRVDIKLEAANISEQVEPLITSSGSL